MNRATASLLLILAAACGSTKEKAGEPDLPPEAIVRSGAIPDGDLVRTSRSAGFEAMCDELAGADVVYLGEYHTLKAHHDMQLQIIRQLHARGRLDGIGMEMFQRPYQEHLDDYIAHRIDEATMLERTEWKKRWGYDFALYKPILDYAYEHRIPVIALNVSTEVRKIVAEQGREGLTDEQRANLPEEDRSFEGYRERIIEVAKMHMPDGHEVEEALIERYHRGQLLWDDVMADSVVRFLRASPKGAQMAVIIGGGHLTNGWGVPARARKRFGGVHKTVVMSMPRAVGDEAMSERYADFVWLAKGVKLPAVPMPMPKATAAVEPDPWDPPEDLAHADGTPEELRTRIDALVKQLLDPHGDPAAGRARLELVVIGKPAFAPLVAALAGLDRGALKWNGGRGDAALLSSAMLADLCLRDMDGNLDEQGVAVIRPGIKRDDYRSVLRQHYRRWKEVLMSSDELPGRFVPVVASETPESKTTDAAEAPPEEPKDEPIEEAPEEPSSEDEAPIEEPEPPEDGSR